MRTVWQDADYCNATLVDSQFYDYLLSFTALSACNGLLIGAFYFQF